MLQAYFFGAGGTPASMVSGKRKFNRLRRFTHVVAACLKAQRTVDLIETGLDFVPQTFQERRWHRETPFDANFAVGLESNGINRQRLAQSLQ